MIIKFRNILPRTLIATASAVAMLLPLTNANAADTREGRERFIIYADVIRAEPIYREVVIREPTQQCWTEEERYMIQEGQAYRGNSKPKRGQGSHRTGDALVGGVIGGVIGNQLGRNGSRSARAGATVAGAVIGTVLANEAISHGGESKRRHRRHRHSNHGSTHTPATETVYGVRPVERCETVMNNRVEQRIEGYKVTYIHRGRRLQTRTRKDPGRQIKLYERIEPVRGQ